jgi:hypothetical protein
VPACSSARLQQQHHTCLAIATVVPALGTQHMANAVAIKYTMIPCTWLSTPAGYTLCTGSSCGSPPAQHQQLCNQRSPAAAAHAALASHQLQLTRPTQLHTARVVQQPASCSSAAQGAAHTVPPTHQAPPSAGQTAGSAAAQACSEPGPPGSSTAGSERPSTCTTAEVPVRSSASRTA